MADVNSLKIPLDIEVSDKELTSLAKSLVQVSKGFSASLESSITGIAARLQYQGWKNKGDVIAKIMSYIPQGQRINEKARQGLSAAVGRGKGLSMDYTRMERSLAVQQARAEAQAEKEAKSALNTYEKYQIAQDLKEAKQIQAVNNIKNKGYAANTEESIKEAFDRQQIEEYQHKFKVLEKYKGMYGVTDKYTRNLTNLAKDVKSINKSTKGEYKELSVLGKSIDRAIDSTKVSPLVGMAKKAFAPVAVASAITGVLKYIGGKFGEGLKAGEDAFTQHAIYGANRDVALSKTLAARWGISEEAAASPQRQALDFRQRLMWGQVSDNEIIGLSRMGEYGRMVISGAAAKDSKGALKALYNFVKNNDEATVRSAFGQAGLPLDLMKALQVAPTFDSYYNTMKTATDMEEASAFMNMRVRGGKNLAEEVLRSSVGSVAKLYNSFDSVGKAQAREFFKSKGYDDEWIKKYIEGQNTGELLDSTFKSLGVGKGMGFAGANSAISSLWSGDVKNDITINVNSPKEAAEASNEITSRMVKQSLSKSITGSINSLWGA